MRFIVFVNQGGRKRKGKGREVGDEESLLSMIRKYIQNSFIEKKYIFIHNSY